MWQLATSGRYTMAKPQFKFLKEVDKNQIPTRQRDGVISRLPLWAEMETLAQTIRKTGVAPFESAAEIDLADLDLKGENGKVLKTAKQSLLVKMREFLKKQKIESKLDLMSRGEKIYLVGR